MADLDTGLSALSSRPKGFRRGDDFLRVHQSLNGKIIDNEKLYEKISRKQNFSGGKKRHPARAIKKAARAAHFFIKPSAIFNPNPAFLPLCKCLILLVGTRGFEPQV